MSLPIKDLRETERKLLEKHEMFREMRDEWRQDLFRVAVREVLQLSSGEMNGQARQDHDTGRWQDMEHVFQCSPKRKHSKDVWQVLYPMCENQEKKTANSFSWSGKPGLMCVSDELWTRWGTCAPTVCLADMDLLRAEELDKKRDVTPAAPRIICVIECFS